MILNSVRDAVYGIKKLKFAARLENDIKKNLNLRKINTELLNHVSYTRNRIAAAGGSGLTTDIILSELIDEAEVLKNAYIHMLALIRVEERGRAIEHFEEETGHRDAREFARILTQMDETDPKGLYDSIASLHTSLGQARITAIKRRDEAVSDILYFPVMLNIVLIFFDFIYVSYFMNQKEMLALLMG